MECKFDIYKINLLLNLILILLAKNNNTVYPVIPESLNRDQSIPPPPYYASAPNQPNMIYGASAPPNNIYQTPSTYVQPTVIIQPQRWFPLSRNPVAMNW
jgi:hypothetical protein